MAPDKNSHVREYLSYYLKLPSSPNYAVLVSGPWGVGKTYLLKKFLQSEFVEGEKKYAYVSLYGLSSIEDIEAALLETMYPALGWKATKVGARIGKSLLKRVGVDVDQLKVTDIISQLEADVFVFDDLERFEGQINRALGYINRFVEHDGSKVILVANETEILDENYRRRREKLIGKTLEVQSDFDDAFAFFLTRVSGSSAKRLLETNAAEIATIYSQSGLSNLRILQQTIWDYERICEALSKQQQGNGEAMAALLRLVFALSFEVKSGRLSADDVKARMDPLTAALSDRAERNQSRFGEAQKRYSDVDLNDMIVSNDVLSDVLVKGVVHSDKIVASLNESRYFAAEANEPAWRTVWHWFERTDEEVAEALDRMEKQFAELAFVVPGEMLHVFGLRLYLSNAGVLDLDRAEVTRQGKKYIDELYTSGLLSPDQDNFSEVRFGGYGGLGMHENKTPEFRDLFAYLNKKQQEALEKSYPQKAAILLNEMQSDPELFHRRLNLTNSEDNIYYDVSILAWIDPKEFVASLIALHPAKRRTITIALESRYERGGLNKELASEKCWLRSVAVELRAQASVLPPIGRHRILNEIASFIDPHLTAEEVAEDGQD